MALFFRCVSVASRGFAAGALALLVALGAPTVLAGCSGGPEVQDVRLTYVRKAGPDTEPIRETYFNEAHSEFEPYRTASLRATMPTPGRDGEDVELRSWPLGDLPPGLDWDEDIPAHFRSRLDYLEPEQVVPSRLPAEERRRLLREQQGLLTWVGSMSEAERDELRGVSSDPAWQRAMFALAQEAPDEAELTSGPSVMRGGYNVLLLPPETFPAEDDLMRPIPEAFDRLGFFRHGLVARDENHALQAFHQSPSEIRAAVILTVDGACTIWMSPQKRPGMSDAEHRRLHERFIQCVKVYLGLRELYRPPTVTADDQREVFYEQERRLREQREAELRRLNEERARHGLPPETH